MRIKILNMNLSDMRVWYTYDEVDAKTLVEAFWKHHCEGCLTCVHYVEDDLDENYELEKKEVAAMPRKQWIHELQEWFEKFPMYALDNHFGRDEDVDFELTACIDREGR